jgi:O-antigen/teichoic acid export membrane protein
VSSIRNLAGQTAIYGVPLILGRILGYLLVPLYVRVFQPGEYGVVNVFYSYAAFLMVVLTYGLETAFFRFYQQEEDKEKVYGTGMSSIAFTSVIFLLLVSLFAGEIAGWIDYPGKRGTMLYGLAGYSHIDAFSAIPLARLRALNRASRFAMIRMANIVVNILLNLFFILFCPYILNHHGDGLIARFIETFYRTDWGIEYIFISNLVASALVIVLLIPEIISTRWKPSPQLWRRMMLYALPLLFAGMAGVINETFDRLLLRYLLPPDIAEFQVGIYSACYKISILMSIFIQAFRYAAEPFFFAQAKQSQSRDIYVKVMNYFIITMSFIFLATMVYLDDFVMPVFIDSVNSEYSEGRNVIPVLMMAHLFLGVYINMSIWYKLTGQTMWGAWFSIIGAVITLVLNFLWIPLSSDHLIYGYYGSAWATFICYAVMMVLSYLIGQKYFPIPYNLGKITGYLTLSVLLYFVSEVVNLDSQTTSLIFHTILLGIFGAVVIVVEKPDLKSLVTRNRQ